MPINSGPEPDIPQTFVQLVFTPSIKWYLNNNHFVYYTKTITLNTDFLLLENSTRDMAIIHTRFRQLLDKLANNKHDPWEEYVATNGIAADCNWMVIADLVHIHGIPFLRIGYYAIDYTPDQEYMRCEEYVPVDPKIIPQLKYLKEKYDAERVHR